MDSGLAGRNYLEAMYALLPPKLIAAGEDLESRQLICQGIGQQIPRLNHYLQDCLTACAHCFHPWQRRSIQIWAVPLADAALDGLCLLHTQPVTICVDLGRVIPEDWLPLVLHEYAHAHLAQPGHSLQFAQTLQQLCCGLGFESVPASPLYWNAWPPLRHCSQPQHFWRTLAASPRPR